MIKLSSSFYLQKDVVALAKALLGKKLYTCINGEKTGGIITETESYGGITDKASHAYNNRKTPRTAPMFLKGGVAYIYLCYGMHRLLNVVTNEAGIPHAILIRAIHPITGYATMLKRRKNKPLCPGPGILTQAMGITMQHNTVSLQSDSLWIENASDVAEDKIIAGPRVGIDYAEEDAFLPWRFRINHLYSN